MSPRTVMPKSDRSSFVSSCKALKCHSISMKYFRKYCLASSSGIFASRNNVSHCSLVVHVAIDCAILKYLNLYKSLQA